MYFIKSIKDYEEYKKKIDFNSCVGPLKNELEIFQNIYKEFENIKVPLLSVDDLYEWSVNNDFNCVATISNNKIITCDYARGEKYMEEFDIDDYKYASNWCVGKIEYQDYLDYVNKEKKLNYIISIWETEEDREHGETFNYPETFIDSKEAIKVAKNLIKMNNYACIEVLNSNDKCMYWSDGISEDYYIETNSKESFINSLESGIEM